MPRFTAAPHQADHRRYGRYGVLPLAFIPAIMTRYETVNLDPLRHYSYLIAAVPLFSIPIFIRLGLYRAVIRYIDQK